MATWTVDRAKAAFLAGVVEDMPDRVDALARRTAQEQPDVTKALGRDRIQWLRAELAGAALSVGDGLLAASSSIEWPNPLGLGASDVSKIMHDEPLQSQFGLAKSVSLPSQCLQCPIQWVCHGECPKDRFTATTGGEPGLTYLYSGYFRFFSHAQTAPSVDGGQFGPDAHPPT